MATEIKCPGCGATHRSDIEIFECDLCGAEICDICEGDHDETCAGKEDKPLRKKYRD